MLSGAGELLGSATVPSTAFRRVAVGRVVCDDGMVRMLPAAHESVGGKEKDSFCFGARKYGIRSLLEEARGSMKVRGRDAMAGSSADLQEECELKLAEAGSQEGETTSERGNKCTICHLHHHTESHILAIKQPGTLYSFLVILGDVVYPIFQPKQKHLIQLSPSVIILSAQQLSHLR